MYLFNIFNESKDNDHNTNIIGMLRYKPPFFRKTLFLKTAKTSYIPSTSLLHLRKYRTNRNKNYISLIRRNWSSRDQNLQFAPTLHKKLKFFILIFFNFNSSFSRKIFKFNIPLGRGFPTIPNWGNFFICSKSYNDLER